MTSKGKQTVSVSGRDYEGADVGSWSYTYTYYVKGPGTSDTTTVSLAGLSNGYKDRNFAGASNYILIHSGDSSHYDVTYTTVPSTADMFRIEQTDGSLGAAANAADNQSSIFDVFLLMDQTRQVTARVKDSKVTTTGTYIIGSPTLTVGYPNDSNGDGNTADAAGSRK